jgi:small lipoprotein (TIGR04454 family)
MLRAALLVILVGCGGKTDEGPSCDKVVDHMLEVTKTQLSGHEGANFNSQRKAMVAQCETRKMSSEMRTCLVGATTIAEIAKCRGTKSDVIEKPRRPRPGKAPGSSTEQSGSGSSSTTPGSAAGSGH